MLPNRYDDGHKEFLQSVNGVTNLVKTFAAAAFAYFVAYRIGKNRMKRDELDYLPDAKLQGSNDEAYSRLTFTEGTVADRGLSR